MTPTEFTLWLNGATDVVDGVPSPEQWMQIKEKLTEAMGHLAKRRLLERAEDLARADEEMSEREAFAKAAMDLKIRQMQSETIDEYQRRMGYSNIGVGIADGIARGQIYRDPISLGEVAAQTGSQPPTGFISALKAKLGGAA